MSKTYYDILGEFNAHINEKTTLNIDQLKQIVLEMSNDFINKADSSNVYTLYSGAMADGTKAEDIAKALKENNNIIRDIGQTHAAMVIKSPEFSTMLIRALKMQVLNDPFGIPTGAQIEELNSLKTLFMNGYDSSGNHADVNSFWDITSKKYVESIPSGSEIRFLGSIDSVSEKSVFTMTELPALLNRANDNLTIEGLSVKKLSEVDFNSALNNVLTEATANAWLSKISPGNTKAFLELDELNRLKQTEEGASELLKLSKKHPNLAKKLGKLAKPLGTAGSLFVFFFVAEEAQAAIDAGDQAKADEIMSEWAVGTAGGAITGTVAVAVTGVAIAALTAAGITISATVAVPVLLVVGIVTSIYGEEVALDLYRSLEDLDENGRRDILDRLWNAVAGVDFIPSQVFDEMSQGKFWHIEKAFSFDNIQKIIDGVNSEDRQTRMAWRYALLNLNPFVVLGIDYDKHNVDGILDQGMSAQYIEDRAKMLLWKLEYDRAGLAYNSDFSTNKIIGNWDFIDHAIQHQGSQELHLGIDGIGLSMNDHQIVFGSNGDDTLHGSNTSDHLYGGAGNDTLKAGDGNDYLEGGTGFDTYEIGKGQHTIYDVDQIGRIIYQGESIDFFDQNVWEQRDSYGSVFRYNDYTVQLITTEKGTTNLKFWRTGTPTDYVLIKDFQNGRMGIFIPALVTDPNPEPIVTNSHIIGDKAPKDMDTNQSGIQTGKDKWGNVNTTNQNDPNRKDELYDTDQNDLIEGLGGDDIIVSKHGGSDLIYGGNGNDIITIRTDKTTGWGENGNDYIVTHAQNNHLFGGNGNDAIFSGGKNAYLNGGDGNDLIHANVDKNTAAQAADPNNNNRLIGGAGSDALISGNTSDLLYADEEMSDITEAWIEGQTGTPKGRGDLLIGNGGDDLFIGSDQNDFIITGGGNNVVYAGDGDDTVRVDDDFYYENVSVKSASDFTPLWELNRFIVENFDGSYQYNTSIGKMWGKEIAVNAGSNSIYLGAGNDWGYGGHGSDSFYSGSGDDVIFGMQGNDYIEGGTGNDILIGDGSYNEKDGDDYIDGGEGDDQIYGSGGSDYLIGGAGNDIIYGDGPGIAPEYEGEDILDGGDGDDEIYGGGKNDILYGGAGNDALIGDDFGTTEANMGDDFLDGGEGDDLLIGNGGNDKLYGGTGNDFLYAGNVNYDAEGYLYATNSEKDGDNYLDGGSGNDVLIGGGGDDTLVAGEGVDILVGGKGSDIFIGGAGENYFYCDEGSDTVFCGSGTNVIFVGGELFNTGSWEKNLLHPSGWRDATGNWEWNGISRQWYHKESGLIAAFREDDRFSEGSGEEMMVISNENNKASVKVYGFDLGSDYGSSMPSGGWIWMGSSSIPEGGDSNWSDKGLSGWQNNPGANWVWLGESSTTQITGGIGHDSIGFHVNGGAYRGGKGDDVFLNHCWSEDACWTAGGYEHSVAFAFDQGDGKDTIKHHGYYEEDGMVIESWPVEGDYTIRFGSGITEDTVKLFSNYGQIVIKIGESDQITLVDYNGSLMNYALDFDFGGGMTNFNDLSIYHDMESSEGDDFIYAHSVFDSIVNSGGGDDLIHINKGTVNAGKGNDEIIISNIFNRPVFWGFDWGIYEFARGDVKIVYNLGDGHDTIQNIAYAHIKPTGANTTISFGKGITEDMVKIELDKATGDLLILMKHQGDQITIKEYISPWGDPIQEYFIEFSNGSVWKIDQNYFIENTAPKAVGNLSDIVLQKDQSLEWSLPGGSFIDADKDDVLSYSATLSDGTALPDWLKIDPTTGKLSGTPLIGDINYQIIITATDKAGATAEHSLTLTVAEFPLGAIVGTNVGDTITGTIGDDIIYGMAGNDKLNGAAGNDKIYGGDGDDTINAGLGDDYVEAGAGNDTIIDVAGVPGGGGGNDTYMFRTGHGQDVMTDQYGNDTVIFADLKLEDARFMREGDHLIIKGHGEDQLTINHFFAHANYYVENFQFGEQKLSINDFWRDGLPLFGDGENRIINGWGGANIIYGGSGNETITTSAGNDKIYGGDGDDTINAGLGDDYVEAGAGNDYIVDVAGEGGGGNDTYLFRQGHGQDILTDQYGNDTVIFADLKLEDARFMREGDHLIIKGHGEDQLTINHFFAHANYYVENFQFGEQKLSINDFWRDGLPLFGDGENRIINGWGGANIIYGGSGNETITTSAGNDKIYGGAGDDIINAGLGDDYVEAGAGNDYIVDVAGEGGGGNDTYLFRQGHGQDILIDQYGSDTVIFADLKLEDARFMREGDHLIIKGHGEDQLTINHFFAHANYYVENFQFGEQKLSINDFWRDGFPLFGDGENRIINGWGGANIIYGGSGNETITTSAGNDKIYGGDGDDIINAGSGNDYVEAGAGNDYITDTKHNGIDGGGNDTYMFRQGHGQDILMDQYGNDTVIFADLKLEDARFMREGDHLIIKGRGEDQLTINHHFFHANYTVENFQFGEQKLTSSDIFPLLGTGTRMAKAEAPAKSFAVSQPSVESQVNNLINAMATFAPEAGSSSTLPTNQYDPNTVLLGASAA